MAASAVQKRDGSGTYTFSSKPRAVQQRKKYRDSNEKYEKFSEYLDAILCSLLLLVIIRLFPKIFRFLYKSIFYLLNYNQKKYRRKLNLTFNYTNDLIVSCFS